MSLNNIISTGFITITDLSDPIISSTEPPNPVEDMLWMDIHITPPVLKIYKNGEWIPVTDIGSSVPDTIVSGGYFKGDLIANKDATGITANGQVQVKGGSFVHPNGTTFIIPDNKQVTANLNRGEGRHRYIIFIGSDSSRFTFASNNESKHFIAATYKDKSWYYYVNGVQTEFIPNDNDSIVAKLEEDSNVKNIRTIIRYYENQDSVFEAITEGGTIQGIYKKDGMLFINAEYIATGKLVSANGVSEFDLDNGTFRLGGTSSNDYNLRFDGKDLYFADGAIKWENLDKNTQDNLRNVTVSIIGGVRSVVVNANNEIQTDPTTYRVKVSLGTDDITNSCSLISWTASGIYSGSASGTTFIPSKGAYTNNESYIEVTATYKDVQFKERIGIAVSKQGDKGATGASGSDGRGIKSITEWYLATSSNSGVTTSTSGWTTSIQTVTSSKKYLWNYEVITYTDNNTITTVPVIIGAYGDKGAAGADGSDGRGINSITEWYLATSSNSGVTTSTSGWTTSVQTVTSSKKYLWNYEVISYTDGSNMTTAPIVIGTYGDKGDTGATGAQGIPGPQGPQGAAGISITKVDVEYAIHTSPTTAPTSGWQTNAPAWVDGKYIWSRTKTTYSSGNPTYSQPACITGGKGNTGNTGATGTGVQSITELYKILDTKVQQPTPTSDSGWSTTPPTWSPGKYIHTCSKIVYNNPTSTVYTVPMCDSSWEAINEIEIGGRNLLLNTDFTYDKTNWSNSHNCSLTILSENTSEIQFKHIANKCVRLEIASNQNYAFLNQTLTLEPNVNYTASVWVYGKVSAGISLYYINNGWHAIGGIKTTSEQLGKWTRLSYTFKANSTYLSTIMAFGLSNKSVGDVCFVTLPQLEKGNKPSDWTPAPEDIDSNIKDVSDALGNLDTSIKDAFGDDIINDSEAKAIASNIQVLTNEKADIDREYSTVYGNSKLEGTAKTNLSSAKTAYDSAHASLVSGINTATSDKKITDAERNSVNSFFSTYRTKLADYKQRVQEALDYISTKKVDDVEIGGTNLVRKNQFALYNGATGSFDNITNTWTLTATPGSSAWGRGLYISNPSNNKVIIPYGKGAIYSWEMKVPKQVTWNSDVNNTPVSGSAWAGNDNDNSVNRRKSAKTITQINQWVKCWSYVENTSSGNTNKVDIKDANSNFGVVTTNETSNITFYVRNFKVEIGNKPTEWSPCPSDVVTKVETLYYLSTSPASQAGGSWTTTLPTITANKFIWMKTVTYYADGSSTQTTPALYQPDWVQDWTGTKTEIGGTSVLSPKIFAGTKESNGLATGVAMGMNIFGSGANYSGIAGYKQGVKTFHFKTDGSLLIGQNTSGSHISWDGSNLSIRANSMTISGTSVATTTNVNEAKSAAISAAASDASNKVNAIQLGGTNYLVGTKTSKNITTTKTDGYITNDPYATYNKQSLATYGLKANDVVTVSFDWKLSNATTYGNFRVEFVNSGTYTGAVGSVVTVSASNNAGRFVGTATLNSTTVLSNTLRIRIDNSNLTLNISNAKLEKGNKVTAWSPSPEDIETDAQSKANAAQSAAISAAASDATTKANNAKTAAINEAVGVKDTRNTNENPQWYFSNYPKRTVQEFKFGTSIGIPGAASEKYGVLETKVPWGDSTGGYPTQKFTSENTDTYYRSGTSTTAWSSWSRKAYATQTDVFNSLTNNGAEQGIYLNNGKVYLNAEYIKTGYIGADRLDANIIASKVNGATTLISGDKIRTGVLQANSGGSYLNLNNGSMLLGSTGGSNYLQWTGSALNIKASSLSIGGTAAATTSNVSTAKTEAINAAAADATTKSNNAKTQAITEAVGVKDTRNDNQNPQWYFTNYPKRNVREFKYANRIGIGSAQVYGVLETNVPWTESSGGYPVQTFTSQSTDTYTRKGTSTTTWGAWERKVTANQKDVFNTLTNNGAEQGLYLSNGKVYLNASYINTGTIDAARINTATLTGKTITSATIRGGSFFTAPASGETDGHAFRIYSDGRVYSKKVIQVYGTKEDGDYSQLTPSRITTTGYVQSSGYKTDNMTMYFAVEGADVNSPTGDNGRRIKLMRTSEGNTYFAPDYPSTIRLGTQNYMWNIAYIKNGVSSSSDRTLKENIHYISDDLPNVKAINNDKNMIKESDLYNFVKDDLFMAIFNFIGDNKKTIGFIAQDLLYNKDGSDNVIGQLLINKSQEDAKEGEQPPLSYNEKTYSNILAGALRHSILKIEELLLKYSESQEKIKELESKIDDILSFIKQVK